MNQPLLRSSLVFLTLILLIALVLLIPSSAAAPRPRAVRGKTNRLPRLLKKDNQKDSERPPVTNPYAVLSSAFGEEEENNNNEEQKFNLREEEQQQQEEEEPQLEGFDQSPQGEEEEYPQQQEYQNQDSNNVGGFDAQQGDSEDEEDFDYDEDEQNDNGKDDKDNGKEDHDHNEGDFNSISLVKLPDFILSLGVEVAPTNRAGGDSPRNNHGALETLIEHYFENLLINQEVMGSTFLSSDLEVSLTKSQNFGTLTGAGSILDFKVKGEAQYDGDPVPTEKQLKERLVAYFIDWGFDNDLGSFLARNGIEGAKATNFYVDGVQMPAFVESNDNGSSSSASSSSSSSSSNGNGHGSSSGSSNTSGTSSSTTTNSDNANAASDEPSEGRSRVGLITGLTLFFLSLIVAGLLFFSTRRELVTECCSWWKAARDNVIKKSAEKLGWQDFQEDDSDSAPSIPEQVQQQQPSQQQEKPSFKWPSWFPFQEKEKEEQEPSAILRQIQVVVDNDHVLKQGPCRHYSLAEDSTGYRNYSLPEDSSGAIVSHQHSAATVPMSNFGNHQHSAATVPMSNFGGLGGDNLDLGRDLDLPEIIVGPDASPQKTMNTCPSDEDEVSLPSPVGRWEPPTRSRSKMYRERRREERHPRREKSKRAAREGREPPRDIKVPTTCTKKSYHAKPKPPPDDVDVEGDDCIGLADWTTFLNPCMLPHLTMFQYESERLDDLVANLPRNRSVLDSSAEISTPSPARRSARPPRARGRIREV